jgi:hypothetical protein
MSNDRANHRIAFLAVPGLRDDPEKFVHAGLHHTAFEYDSFDDLMSSFACLRQLGIEPEVCLNRGFCQSRHRRGSETSIRSTPPLSLVFDPEVGVSTLAPIGHPIKVEQRRMQPKEAPPKQL